MWVVLVGVAGAATVRRDAGRPEVRLVDTDTLLAPGGELPRRGAGEEVVRHAGFGLVYSEQYEQARWVAYELTAAETQRRFERTDRFLVDPRVGTGTATDADYAGSGYDRGHLAPAADMGWSEATMRESFYYSNMSPQVPGFNRGVWKRLEELVRTWAVEYGAIYVVTGPVLQPGLPTIGPHGVAVPRQYFKVILDAREPGLKAVGFLMQNASSSAPLAQFAVPIDSVERVTGLDFFPGLPDAQESQLEGKVCVPCWTWTSAPTGGGGEGAAGESVRCTGTTQKGERCKRMTRSPNGRCYQHGGNLP